jgi:hypothetical protein
LRKKLDPKIKTCRAKHPFALRALDDFNSAYLLRSPVADRQLYILVSDGEGWDHVSVSVVGSDEPPTWAEMAYIKNVFFHPEECVIQYHPPQSRYVNIDTGCLHLWRPQRADIPMPPLEFV